MRRPISQGWKDGHRRGSEEGREEVEMRFRKDTRLRIGRIEIIRYAKRDNPRGMAYVRGSFHSAPSPCLS